MFENISNHFNSKRTRQFGICLITLLCWHQITAQHKYNVWQSRGPTYDIISLAVAPSSPNTLVAAGGDYYCCGLGAFKSTNYGFNWSQVTPGGGYPDWIGPVAIDPVDAHTFYVHKFIPFTNGVFKTTNGGQSWNLVLSSYVSSLKIAPSDRNVIYGIGGGLHVSINGGTDWATRQLPIQGGSDYGTIAVHPNDPNILFAAMSNNYTFGGTYKSTNGGLSWIALGIPWSASIFIDPLNPDIVYATASGLRKSVDGGSTWTFIPTPYPPNALAIDTRRNTIYIGSEIYGVYKSSDGGASWQAFNNGLLGQPYDYVYELVMDNDGGILHAGTGWGVFSVRVIPRSNADFDGDGKTDIAVFRPSDSVWYLNQSRAGFSAAMFGLSTDKIAPADYDGDGKTDIAVFRDGIWYWLNSSNGNFNAMQFGLSGDVSVPADFSGDGRAELAVYRDGNWFTLNLTNNRFNAAQFGLSTDKPVVADYDGDGRADYAVYREGVWYLLQSTQGFAAIQFGLSTDKLVPADYDGDGKTDLAVYRDGTWYLRQSNQGFAAFQFGFTSDTPAPADYDGDGRTDAAVYRDGTWYLRQSANGFETQQFGLANDKPIPSSFLP